MQDLEGPRCAAPCSPVTRLVLRCQVGDPAFDGLFLRAYGAGGRGDSHPRRVEVRGLDVGDGLRPLVAAFAAQVYDNGTWVGPSLDFAQVRLLAALSGVEVVVAGEGERRVARYSMTGLPEAWLGLCDA